MYSELLSHRIAALRAQPGLSLRALTVGPGLDDLSIRRLASAARGALDPDLLAFYREVNGLELSWSVYPDGEEAGNEIPGGILIPPLEQAIFGWCVERGRSDYEGAFEDELWSTESYAEESIAELRRHRVLERIEGDSANVTFIPGSPGLWYVYEEDIDPIVPDVGTYLRVVLTYLGAGTVREMMVFEGFDEAINESALLRMVGSWREP